MTKQQMTKAAKHIVDYYGEGFLEDAKTYGKAAELVQDGCFLIWYADARAFLKDLYEESEEQSEKYSNEKVWEQYKHCIALMASHPKYIEQALQA